MHAVVIFGQQALVPQVHHVGAFLWWEWLHIMKAHPRLAGWLAGFYANEQHFTGSACAGCFKYQLPSCG
jgi:hypothetical protein